MARQRKSRMGKSKPRTDWIYTGFGYAAAASTAAPGPAGALAFALSYSQNARRLSGFGAPGVAPVAGTWAGWEGIPEGSQQRCYEVQGQLDVGPVTWAVGNEFMCGWRLLFQEQSPDDALMLADPDYSMFSNGVSNTIRQIANSGFLKESRFTMSNVATSAVTNSGRWLLNVHWKSERGVRIGNNQAMFLWFEVSTGSVSVRMRPYVRSRWLIE